MPEIFIWGIVIVLVFVAVLVRRGYRPNKGPSRFGPGSDSTDIGSGSSS